MIVVDASVILELLLKGTEAAPVREAVSKHRNWAAPHLLDVEVTQVLRRFVRSGECNPQRAQHALETLNQMRITRYAHQPFLERIWAWRENLTAYDAPYVALAEALDCLLLTRDRKLAASAGSITRLL